MSSWPRKSRGAVSAATSPTARADTPVEAAGSVWPTQTRPGCGPPRPVYVDVRGEWMLGLLHAADGSGPAVLLCPPFGREEVASYRCRLEWAESLAAAGMPALRFDLPGTGDSSGSSEGMDRVGSWIASITAAAEFVRGDTRRIRTTAIGIGLGGLVALAAVADGAPIDDLVLWSVPAHGRALVRELMAFAQIESASIVAAGGQAPPGSSAQVIGPGGFVLPAETMRSLERLEFANLRPLPGFRRALLLGRDGIAPDEDLRRGLAAAGVEVEIADGHGFGGMVTALPESARLPAQVRDRVNEWLLQVPLGAADRLARSTRRPVTAPFADLVEGETRIRETPLEIPYPGGRLFGILCEPLDVPSSGLTMVLLNAGAIRHIGPSRLWVAIARRWAARGVPTLRVDLGGIGEASGDAARYVDVEALYRPGYVDQVRTALDELVSRGAPKRFALLGLCAGAYWAFHTTLVDDRVSLSLMLNPRLLFWKPEIQSARAARNRRRQLLRARSWRRVLSARWWQVGLRLLSLGTSTVTEPLRIRARLRVYGETWAAAEEAFDRLQRSAARAVFVFCDGEPLRDELAGAGMLTRADRWSRVQFLDLPGRDHVLRPLWMHEHVHATVDGVLESELSRARQGAGGGSAA